MPEEKKKGMTPKQKEEQTKKLITILRSPIYSKKQKRITAFKWRFNQLPEDYRHINIKKYLYEIAKMEAMPESEFEHLTKF